MHNMGQGNPTGIASIVGFLNGSEDSQGSILSGYLKEARRASSGNPRTVAEIAYEAATNMATDFPYYYRQEFGLATLGGYVLVQDYEPTDVNTSGGDGEMWIRQICTGAEQSIVMFNAPNAGKYTIKVYDLKGRMVKTITKECPVSRAYSISWDGTDSYGRESASGIYLVKVINGDTVGTGKISVVR